MSNSNNSNNSNYNNENSMIASLIVLYRQDSEDRTQNLHFFLRWLNKFYPSVFDIILVEQDTKPKLLLPDDIKNIPNLNKKFLYNPTHFNRGWGFNCAVRHWARSDVLVLADTDVLIPSSFIQLIDKVKSGEFDVISPYKNIYYTTPDDKLQIIKDWSYDFIDLPSKPLTRAATIGGGLTICSKDLFMRIGGYEQYSCYGYEDRVFDANVLQLLDEDKIMINDDIYVHLYHAKNFFNNKTNYFNMKEANTHMEKYYGCKSGSVKNKNNIHENCDHLSPYNIMKLCNLRRRFMGDVSLYLNRNITDIDYPVNSIPSYEGDKKDRVLLFGDSKILNGKNILKGAKIMELLKQKSLDITTIYASQNKNTINEFIYLCRKGDILPSSYDTILLYPTIDEFVVKPWHKVYQELSQNKDYYKMVLGDIQYKKFLVRMNGESKKHKDYQTIGYDQELMNDTIIPFFNNIMRMVVVVPLVNEGFFDQTKIDEECLVKFVGGMNRRVDFLSIPSSTLSNYFFKDGSLTAQGHRFLSVRIHQALMDLDSSSTYYPILEKKWNKNRTEDILKLKAVNPNQHIDDLIHFMMRNEELRKEWIEEKYSAILERINSEYDSSTVVPWPYSYLTQYNSDKKLDRVDNTNLSDNKFITFVVGIKNRPHRTLLMLKSLVTEENLKMCDFMVVEDKPNSDELELILDDWELGRDNITHYKIDSKLGWSRGTLLNYGFKRAKTRLVAACDSDFIFCEDFVQKLRDYCLEFNFQKYLMGISTYESDSHFKFPDVYYPQGTPYGCMWVYDMEVINKVRGFNEYIVGWGFEEKDLEHRAHKALGMGTMYSFKFQPDLFVIHLSHTDRKIKGFDRITNNRLQFNILKQFYAKNGYIVNCSGVWGEGNDLNLRYYEDKVQNNPIFKMAKKEVLRELEQEEKEKNQVRIKNKDEIVSKQKRKNVRLANPNMKINQAILDRLRNRKNRNKSKNSAIEIQKKEARKKVLEQVKAKPKPKKKINQPSLLDNTPIDTINSFIEQVEDMDRSSQFAKFLDGKRVVIVGPAPSMIGSKQKLLINSYDVVVRINKAWRIDQLDEEVIDDIGDKIDILYNCMDTHPECGGEIDLQKCKELGVKFICNPYPAYFDKDHYDILFRGGYGIINSRNFVQKLRDTGMENNILFHQMDKKKFLRIVKEMDTRMNTGIGAIIDLLSFNIKELYITGFTFFQGGYMKSYRDKNEVEVMKFMNSTGWHDQDKQLDWMKKNIFDTDNRVRMDMTLKKIVRGFRYEPKGDQVTIPISRIKMGETVFYRDVKPSESKIQNKPKLTTNIKQKVKAKLISRDKLKPVFAINSVNKIDQKIRVIIGVITTQTREDVMRIISATWGKKIDENINDDSIEFKLMLVRNAGMSEEVGDSPKLVEDGDGLIDTLLVPGTNDFMEGGERTNHFIKWAHNSPNIEFDYLIKLNDDLYPNLQLIKQKLLNTKNVDYIADKTITWDIRSKPSKNHWFTQQFMILSKKLVRLYCTNEFNTSDLKLQDKSIDTIIRKIKDIKKEYLAQALLWDIKNRGCIKFNLKNSNKIDIKSIKINKKIVEDYYVLNMSGMMGGITRYTIKPDAMFEMMDGVTKLLFNNT